MAQGVVVLRSVEVPIRELQGCGLRLGGQQFLALTDFTAEEELAIVRCMLSL